MGFQTYLCPICGGRHYIEIGGEATGVLANLISSLQSQHARKVLREFGIKRRGGVMKVHTLKKMAKKLQSSEDDREEKFPVRMLGALIVEHNDGQKSRLIAQSGGEDLDLHECSGGYKVAKKTVEKGDNPSLARIFGGGKFSYDVKKMTKDQFTKKCAAMKLFIALADSVDEIRKGSGKGILTSKSGIVNIIMAEEVYRPFTTKTPKGFRQYRHGDFDDEETEHLAPSCDQCKIKVPAIMCPVSRVTKKNKIEIFESAKKLVEKWEKDYHSLPWGNRGKNKIYIKEK